MCVLFLIDAGLDDYAGKLIYDGEPYNTCVRAPGPHNGSGDDSDARPTVAPVATDHADQELYLTDGGADIALLDHALAACKKRAEMPTRKGAPHAMMQAPRAHPCDQRRITVAPYETLPIQ